MGGVVKTGEEDASPSTPPLDPPLIAGRAKRISFAVGRSLTLDRKSPTKKKGRAVVKEGMINSTGTGLQLEES